MQLSDFLARVPPGRRLWCSPDGTRFAASDLAQWLASFRRRIGELSDSRVAVFASEDIDIAALLLALDGFGKQIAVLPRTSDLEFVRSFVRETSTQTVLTTNALDAEKLEGSGVSARLLLDPLTVVDQEPVGPSCARRRCPTRWVLATSGTTGQPKLVSHTLRSLTRTTKRDLERGSAFAWGSLYSLASFAGLQVFLQGLLAGSCLILGRGPWDLSQRISHLVEHRCNAISATPTMWRMILMLPQARELGLSQITLGGEIVDQPVLDALKRAFPRANVTHIYASTEAGAGFAVRDGLAGFPVDYLQDAGDDIRLRVCENGHLSLKCENLDQEYVGERLSLRDAEGYIDTGDIVEQVGDRFLFLGRSNGVINVGGQKVHPQEVENLLLRSPEVQVAEVFARKNPFTGSIVHARVVLRPGRKHMADQVASQLRAICRDQLQAYKVPAVVEVVGSIDLSPAGKVRRQSRSSG